MEEEIKIIPTDTAESVFLRMASKLNSIPKYLYMKDVPVVVGRTQTKLGQQSVVDIAKIVKNKSLKTVVVDLFTVIRTETNIKKFAQVLKDNLVYFPELSLENDIIKPWLYFNITVVDDDTSLIVFDYINTINNALGTKVNINTDNFKIEKSNNMREFTNTMMAIQHKNREILASYKEVDSLYYTPFEPEKVKYALQISENYTLTLQEIFDSVILSAEFPFCQLIIDGGIYYKIYKDFIPDIEWATTPDMSTQIILKFLTGKVEKTISLVGDEILKPIYEDVRAITENGNGIILLDASLDKKEEDLFRKVLNIFQRQLEDVVKTEPVSIKGVFYIPHETFDKYIFSHLVMNDINFSALVIDEAGKPTKVKTGLYIYYIPKGGNEDLYTTSLILTPKVMDRFDPTMKNKDPSLFPENEEFIRVRVTAKNDETIREIQENMGRLMALYNYKFTDILKFYRQYIKKFDVEKAKDVKTFGKKNKKKESRRCPYPPIVIAKEDECKYTDTMTFPHTNDVNKEPQRIYACEPDKKHDLKFVGLQLRRDSGDFVPCCFQTDQKQKSGSDYNKYIKYIETGEKVGKTSGKHQQRIIKTKKFLKYQEFSDNLVHTVVDTIFNFAEPEKNHFRFGSHKSKMSMINCLLEVFRKEKTIITEDLILKTKIEIANDRNLLSLCKQSLPNNSIDEISNLLLGDIYIDPRIFTNLLEEYFDCRIHTFNDQGLIVPIYKKNYLQYQRQLDRDRVVVLVEHMGAECDHSSTPQCEVITYTDGTDDAQYVFDRKSTIARLLDGISKRMTRSYFLNTKTAPFPDLQIKPVGQRFDSSGKVFAFMFNVGGTECVAYTKRPFPPLPIAVFSLTIPVFPTVDELRKQFTGTVNRGVFETSDFIFPLEVGTKTVLPQSQNSTIKEFALYSKLAKYINEYVLYAYSWYISDNVVDVGDESITAFSRQVVVGDVNYGAINKYFSRDNTIYNNKKLFLPSEEILKRCMYVLKLEAHRNPLAIKEYKSQRNIFPFLDTTNDYTEYPLQTIVFGKEAFQKYIMEFFTSQEIDYNIGFNGGMPHYYKFENNIYLSQNILPVQKERDSYWKEPAKDSVVHPREGFAKALNTCYNWETVGVNSEAISVEVDAAGEVFTNDVSVLKYSRDDTDFKTEKFTELNDIDSADKIIAYKIKNVPKYTVLLNLSKIKV